MDLCSTGKWDENTTALEGLGRDTECVLEEGTLENCKSSQSARLGAWGEGMHKTEGDYGIRG